MSYCYFVKKNIALGIQVERCEISNCLVRIGLVLHHNIFPSVCKLARYGVEVKHNHNLNLGRVYMDGTAWAYPAMFR